MLPGEGPPGRPQVLVRLRLNWPVTLHRAVLPVIWKPPDTLMLHHPARGVTIAA